MFRVKQLSHTTRHHQQSPTPTTAHEPAQKPNEICIRFANGKTCIYDKSELKQFTLPFHNTDLEFTDITQEQFSLMLSLFSDHKCLHQVLSVEDYANPFFYEEMHQVFQQFFPQYLDLVMDLIKKFQMKFLTLSQSKMILKGFEEAKTSQDPRIQNLLKQHPDPLAVQEAKLVEVKAAAFFPNENDAVIYFTQAQIVANELYACELLLTYLEMDLPLAKEAHVPVLKLRIAGLKKQIEYCNSKMESGERIFNPKNMSLMTKQRLQVHLNSDNEFLRKVASEAKLGIEQYRESILGAQRRSGADMSRTDLLEYLIGPKGYLLDHYRLVPRESGMNTFPYIGYGQRFGYRLENDGPYDLESEIRNDVSRFTSQLPERLIQTREITKLIPKECEELAQTVLPFLEKFSPDSPETKWTAPLHRDIISKLYMYNGWDKLNVSPDNMRVTSVHKDENGIYHVKGQVFLGSSERLIAYPFSFRSNDYILLINDENVTGTDKVITANFIRRFNT